MWKKKKSILWQLPYWETLEVHDAIDVLHLMKYLLHESARFPGDIWEVERYIGSTTGPEHLKQQHNLHLENRDKGQQYLCPASYTLSKKEKDSMCDCMNSINVTFGYTSNINEIINMK